MRRTFIAIQVKDDNNKYYAYIVPCTTSDNLLSKLKIKGIVSATVCETKKQAADFVDGWNKGHKENNRYMFDDMPF